MLSYVKPLAIGFLGAVLAFGVFIGYQTYQEHRALMAWAVQTNQWIASQQPKPVTPFVPQTVPAGEVGKPPVDKAKK